MVDRYLSDGEWRDIAATYLDRIGLARPGPARRRPGGALGRGPARRRPRARCGHPGPPGRPAGVPPQRLLPGRRVFPRNDFYRAGEASRAVEATYGLTVTAAKRATYAETQKGRAARSGRAGARHPAPLGAHRRRWRHHADRVPRAAARRRATGPGA